MKTQKVSLKMILDTRRKKASDEFPIKLRITHNRRRKYYGVGYDVAPREWEMITRDTAKGKLRKLKHMLNDIEKDAQETSESIHPFSFSQFEKEFFDNKITFQTLEAAYDFYIEKLKKNNQYGTAESYNAALTSLQKFRPHLAIEQINMKDIAFLKWKNVNTETITFERAKTANTKRSDPPKLWL
ncbi:MAG TPA: Arm DNA-binding domain-containing protein [Chitinophagaceae bacterium]|nr:Arm DNA-binding domain-containing protein [Chitinophagaceae bacterium]